MINIETLMIENAPTYIDGIRYLRTKFQDNKERFLKRYISQLEIWLSMNNIENANDIISFYTSLWDITKSFSYKEAFSITDQLFRNTVFSTINVPEMVKELGHKRIKTEGIELINKIYNPISKSFQRIKFTQIYELHKINGAKLKLNESLFAIKCWCTSTDQEHWLWIDKEIGSLNDPLTAIASTCKVYEEMIPHIKHIIRQGDIFLFELSNNNFIPDEKDKIIPLNKKQYFGLLKSQS